MFGAVLSETVFGPFPITNHPACSLLIWAFFCYTSSFCAVSFHFSRLFLASKVNFYHSFRNHHILNPKTISLCNCNCNFQKRILRNRIRPVSENKKKTLGNLLKFYFEGITASQLRLPFLLIFPTNHSAALTGGLQHWDIQLLGPATTQNLVVKFDGEICGGVLVEHASDDFPRKRSSKISFQTSPEVRHQFRRKLRQLHSGNRWC